MDLCLSCWKENPRIEVRAEGSAFAFGVFGALHNRVHRSLCRQARNPVEALEQIRQGIRERFGGLGPGVARGLQLRHDGSNYLANDFQAGYTRIVHNFHGVYWRSCMNTRCG